ncbi:DUF6624 domain-containing protein [Streptomyces sp. MK5]|uniref:DUF6624 domain-containing protein n=1 Tax=Streptomyces sp. MK5 TaxID=3064253 RepID=UPI0027410DA7|nr:DUF6624 domain-containing protein [Streptomyces sp. MK5]
MTYDDAVPAARATSRAPAGEPVPGRPPAGDPEPVRRPAGDPLSGGPVSGDRAYGGPVSGDRACGGRVSGDRAHGGPVRADSATTLGAGVPRQDGGVAGGAGPAVPRQGAGTDGEAGVVGEAVTLAAYPARAVDTVSAAARTVRPCPAPPDAPASAAAVTVTRPAAAFVGTPVTAIVAETARRADRTAPAGHPRRTPAPYPEGGAAEPPAAGTAPAPAQDGCPQAHADNSPPALDAVRDMPAEGASALAAELVRRAGEDRELTRKAGSTPTPERRRRVVECHRDNAEALAAIVRRHGWPAVDLVGPAASTAALMILLHAPGLRFRLRCRDLIAQAAADGRCPAVHLAYIADHCAVELGEPQYYGTRINPLTLRPYPVRRPETLDERRQDVGLGPLEEQMRALRLRD